MASSYSCLSFARSPGSGGGGAVDGGSGGGSLAAFLQGSPRSGRQHLGVYGCGRLPRHSRSPPLPALVHQSTPLLPAVSRGRRLHLLPSASLSPSFAESEGGDGAQSVDSRVEEGQSGELPAMANAFHISLRTASAICICIAFAALTLPLMMRSLTQVSGLKMRALSYLTLLLGFYMAWNIGANDVANAMGTSVGSGALTIRQAVLTAAVLEFSGALLMGTHVTSTMQNGIIMASVFQEKSTLLFAGLLSSLAAAGTWLQVCARALNSSPILSCALIWSLVRFLSISTIKSQPRRGCLASLNF